MKHLKHKDKAEPRAETQAALERNIQLPVMGAEFSGAGAKLPVMVRTQHGWRILKPKDRK